MNLPFNYRLPKNWTHTLQVFTRAGLLSLSYPIKKKAQLSRSDQCSIVASYPTVGSGYWCGRAVVDMVVSNDLLKTGNALNLVASLATVASTLYFV